MNHRVKNNLFVVKSLLDLRENSRDIDLSDIKNQILSISQVHELLVESNDFRRISARQYLGAILESVFRERVGTDVEVTSEIDDIAIPSGTAVPVGLVLNEAASNALRHGVIAGRTLSFRAALKSDKDSGTCLLIMENNGRPIPDDVDPDRPSSLGLQLLSALTRQIHGSLTFTRKPHTVVTLEFPYREEG